TSATRGGVSTARSRRGVAGGVEKWRTRGRGVMRSKPPLAARLRVVWAMNERLVLAPAAAAARARASEVSSGSRPITSDLGKDLGERHAYPPDPASHVEDAPAALQALKDVGNCVQPQAGEALRILAAVQPIERLDPLGPKFAQRHAAAVSECLCNFRRDRQQHRGEEKEAAHKVVGPVRGQQIRVLIGQFK